MARPGIRSRSLPATVIILVFLLFHPSFLFSQDTISVTLLPENCPSGVERKLAEMINAYRAEKGLPPVALSVSLDFVARTHTQDLENNYKPSDRCNMHSWSGKGKWTSCCYTPDHSESACMWNKPRELTSYKGNGYEIAFYTTGRYDDPAEFAREILNGWKGSPLHNQVILNRGIWTQVNWKAMGVGVSGGYATVWFGEEPDPAGEPAGCK